MRKQLLFEDIKVGEEIPGKVKRSTTRQLVRWGCLRDEFYELHYDKDYAIGLGFPGVIVQGEMIISLLVQILTSWLGDNAFIRKLDYSFRAPILVNENILCKGNVTQKYHEAGTKYLQCDIWTENEAGKTTATGTALVVLN